MRKPEKPVRREPPAWEVLLPPQGRTDRGLRPPRKGPPAAFVGVVYAEDEEGAIAAAIEGDAKSAHPIRGDSVLGRARWPRVAKAMDRSVIQQRLAETEEQIPPGENQIVQQRRLIAQLETDGSSASHAKYLLAGLELLEPAGGTVGIGS